MAWIVELLDGRVRAELDALPADMKARFRRIAELIQHRFRVRYHRNHVGKLLRQLHWSPQKPEGRALERDDARNTETLPAG